MQRVTDPMPDEEIEALQETMKQQHVKVRERLAKGLGGDPDDYRGSALKTVPGDGDMKVRPSRVAPPLVMFESKADLEGLPSALEIEDVGEPTTMR